MCINLFRIRGRERTLPSQCLFTVHAPLRLLDTRSRRSYGNHVGHQAISIHKRHRNLALPDTSFGVQQGSHITAEKSGKRPRTVLILLSAGFQYVSLVVYLVENHNEIVHRFGILPNPVPDL
ncbi:hypothetical protein KM472_gp063 [Cynomolgus macaque cytomegalovirus strain Ottawa]|uniref:Uncharacterized protein n=1 Tax=macacine betaherpesvirus 8 TaxID=2560567 RepID=G8H166_9BETA|nr:hypothetical protein KM472_gp063 [Cynomolgus macaque cytomegalovirus strain Ottawa]AEQ32140.1 hypothetical protein cy61 [Cynomolgus macaque cytomegalovirus strain Ottawa]